MAGIRFLVSVLSTTAIIPNLMAQHIALPSGEVNITDASEESEDLEVLKQGKWIVVSVERDGKTIPGQFGQKPGDIITFKTGNGHIMFG